MHLRRVHILNVACQVDKFIVIINCHYIMPKVLCPVFGLGYLLLFLHTIFAFSQAIFQLASGS